MKIKLYIVAALALSFGAANASELRSFDHAKQVVKEIYYDRPITTYCGCPFEWNERGTGGTLNPEACGYEAPGWHNRSYRIEYEHVVPASTIGQNYECWSMEGGGRAYCARHEPSFQLAYADPVNLVPIIGSLNAARSNIPLGMVNGNPDYTFGACDMSITRRGAAKPPAHVKGKLARIKFYMADRYGVPLPLEQQQELLNWHQLYPPSEWEFERELRLQRFGYSNPFVTGQKEWELREMTATFVSYGERTHAESGVPVIGNRRSGIYHLPGCPSYGRVGEANRVIFRDEEEAINAGYRIAGNC